MFVSSNFIQLTKSWHCRHFICFQIVLKTQFQNKSTFTTHQTFEMAGKMETKQLSRSSMKLQNTPKAFGKRNKSLSHTKTPPYQGLTHHNAISPSVDVVPSVATNGSCNSGRHNRSFCRSLVANRTTWWWRGWWRSAFRGIYSQVGSANLPFTATTISVQRAVSIRSRCPFWANRHPAIGDHKARTEQGAVGLSSV